MKPDLVARTVGDDHASGCLVLPQGSGQPMQIAQGCQALVNLPSVTLAVTKIYGKVGSDTTSGGFLSAVGGPPWPWTPLTGGEAG